MKPLAPIVLRGVRSEQLEDGVQPWSGVEAQLAAQTEMLAKMLDEHSIDFRSLHSQVAGLKAQADLQAKGP